GKGEFYQNFCENPPNITYSGSFHFFAANGDELFGTFEGYLSPTGAPGVYDNHETADATGGAGRFTNATGHWDAGGQIDVTTEPLCFSLPLQGWISSVGSNRRETFRQSKTKTNKQLKQPEVNSHYGKSLKAKPTK